jgi:hypothetical protein
MVPSVPKTVTQVKIEEINHAETPSTSLVRATEEKSSSIPSSDSSKPTIVPSPANSNQAPSTNVFGKLQTPSNAMDVNNLPYTVPTPKPSPQPSTTSIPTSTSGITLPKKARRLTSEQLAVTLLPLPSQDKSKVSPPMHKPFLIAPTNATVEHLSLLIGASTKSSSSPQPVWRLTHNTNPGTPLDQTLSLDWINKHHFLPHHREVVLYFFAE